jgi:hypothetical protein
MVGAAGEKSKVRRFPASYFVCFASEGATVGRWLSRVRTRRAGGCDGMEWTRWCQERVDRSDSCTCSFSFRRAGVLCGWRRLVFVLSR